MSSTTYEVKPNLPLTDAHLRAIGRVVANWTLIEDTLERYIWFQISMGHEVGKCLTTHMGYQQRLNAVLTLSHDMFMPHAEEQFDALVKFAKKLTNDISTKRNNIVHATWESDQDLGEPVIAKRTARVKLKEQALPYTVIEIEKVALEIEDAFCELNRLLLELEPTDQFGQKPPSWLDQRHWRKVRRR